MSEPMAAASPIIIQSVSHAEEPFPQLLSSVIKETGPLVTEKVASVAGIVFSDIAVFGDSLSDSGNAYSLWGQETAPPYDTLDKLKVPVYPYAEYHRYCNGPTWIELFAKDHNLERSGGPVFSKSNEGCMNFAVGRARARNTQNTERVDLSKQVDQFLCRMPKSVPKDTLCFLEIGANDIRDAINAPKESATIIIEEALNAIDQNIKRLYSGGVRKFLVWDIPDIGKTPALQSLDKNHLGIAEASTCRTIAFNTGLKSHIIALSKLQGIAIVKLDVYKKLDHMVSNQKEYGLSVVNVPCVMPKSSPCYDLNSGKYLFWDGIHPSEVFHKAISDAMSQEAFLEVYREEGV